MRLKEKTHKKFVDFFEKMSKLYHGQEFEMAYSDIQRETGAASVTLKRAIQSLENGGIIEVNPGRNSRYGRFRYLLNLVDQDSPNNNQVVMDEKLETNDIVTNLLTEVTELTQLVEQLRRRVRTQEMSIALLQDRVAEFEDKLHKR